MKTYQRPGSGSRLRLPRLLAAAVRLLCLFVAAGTSLHAGLPEPDNVLFGRVVRDGIPVTAADYDVTIEVRRSPSGPAIARYTMGSNARIGDLYSIRVRLESIAPVSSPSATLTNDRVYVVVTDFNGDRSATNVVVAQRGTLRRVDLGGPASGGSGDSDFDGLPDAWELARFGTLLNGPDTVGNNGQTALMNYLAGTDPNNPDDVFRLTITPFGAGREVSFPGRAAAGAGYEGMVRLYSLEYTTNAGGSPWVPIPGQTNLLGNNTTLRYSTAESGPAIFYRGQVKLVHP